MNDRLKKIAILLPFLLAAGFIYAWVHIWNVGDIKLKTNVGGFTVETESKTVNCPQTECHITVKSGVSKLILKKEGYHAQEKFVGVNRGETKETAINLLKIAKLLPSQAEPPAKKPLPGLPKELDDEKAVGAVWSKDAASIVFLDKEDARVKIWSKTGIRLVTELKDITSGLTFHWGPEQNWIVGEHEDDLYLMEIQTGTRRKVKDIKIKNMLFAPAPELNSGPEALFNDTENKVIRLSLKTGQVEPTGLVTDLSRAVWINAETLVYLAEKEGLTQINAFNTNGTTTNLISNAFAIDRVWWDAENRTAHFHNAAEDRWYRLEL